MKRPETRIIHTRGARLGTVTVNPPVERASTVLFKTEKALYDSKPGYGRMGLSVHRELEAALSELEGGSHVRLASNGLQACALAIASCVESGGHILIPDSAYGPTARFCERRLKYMGVSATRYDPRIGAGIADLIRPETQAIFMESPGSLTFEISDIPAITAVAREHSRGARTRRHHDCRQHLGRGVLPQAAGPWRRHRRPGDDEIYRRPRRWVRRRCHLV